MMKAVAISMISCAGRGIELYAVTPHLAEDARFAYRDGRGNHAAALNLGDCFAYALARATGEPLLFKGADFAKTDIPSAPQEQRRCSTPGEFTAPGRL
jgi:uncharacterized protein with PIN domain